MVSVAQSCPTLCSPKDCGPPGFSVHGILQARILEQVAISSSRRSSQPRDQTHVSQMWQVSSLPLAPLKEPACLCRRHKSQHRLDPWVATPGGGRGNSLLSHRAAESQTGWKQLSTHARPLRSPRAAACCTSETNTTL